MHLAGRGCRRQPGDVSRPAPGEPELLSIGAHVPPMSGLPPPGIGQLASIRRVAKSTTGRYLCRAAELYLPRDSSRGWRRKAGSIPARVEAVRPFPVLMKSISEGRRRPRKFRRPACRPRRRPCRQERRADVLRAFPTVELKLRYPSTLPARHVDLTSENALELVKAGEVPVDGVVDPHQPGTERSSGHRLVPGSQNRAASGPRTTAERPSGVKYAQDQS